LYLSPYNDGGFGLLITIGIYGPAVKIIMLSCISTVKQVILNTKTKYELSHQNRAATT
jgi:hypothetical protein